MVDAVEIEMLLAAEIEIAAGRTAVRRPGVAARGLRRDLRIVVALGLAVPLAIAVGLQIAPPLIGQKRLHLLVGQPRVEVAVDDRQLGLLRTLFDPDLDVHRASSLSRT